jgi:2-polyprenyl-3-methyl-5-hydroxy-6-metoxy-1,4-benzoquinol methylase
MRARAIRDWATGRVTMIPRAKQLITYVIGPRVLDVGCAGHVPEPGSEYWLHGELVRHFPESVGIDLNRQNVEALRSIGMKNLYVCSAEDFSFDTRFDSIVAGELIEHLSNPGLFLRCAASHLAVGGRIIITTPNPFSLLNFLYGFCKFPKTCQNPEHTCWFCVATLQEIARREELRVLEWQLIEDYRPNSASLSYRTFVWLLRFCGWMLPERLRCNAMIFVLEKDPGALSSTKGTSTHANEQT